MQNQQDRGSYSALDPYFPHRVNYVELVSRPHEEATRRSDEFTPPGARWLAGKKGVPSSPAPNRVLPQPQAMNHFPYAAGAAMLPTPPMSVRQPSGRPKPPVDEDVEPFPPLATHWPSLQEDADRERWRHSEESETHDRQGSASPQHAISQGAKSSLDRRDSQYIATMPSNSWWRRRDSLPSEDYDAIAFQHDDPDRTDDRPAKKRCQNAFFVFSSERRGEIRAQQPRIRNSDLSKILGKEWNDLSEERRSHYKNRAEILKEQSYQADQNAPMIGSLLLSSLSPTSSSSPCRYSDSNGSDANMFSTPRHLSISSERSHDALFVAANNTSPADWQTNHGSKDHDDEGEDSDEEEPDTSSASPPLATTGARNVVSVASHSGAAEAEALAGLTVPRTVDLKRPPPKRHGEKPRRVKRPPNAYLLFNRDVRHKILDGNPNLTVAEISKSISEQWNNLPEESKAHYNRKAAQLKQRHMDEHPNFIYTRRSKKELKQAGYRSRPSKKRKVEETPVSNSGSESTGDKPAVKERDPRGRKKKRLKNPTAPKHPMSGFLFYSISVRAEIVVNMPKATVGEISKVIAGRWRRLTEEERAPWIGKAKEDKERYAREMESFTAASMAEGLEQDHAGRQGNMSPVELDSHTIATVAQMVNPRGEHLLPPLSSSPRQYQVLPATPRNDD